MQSETESRVETVARKSLVRVLESDVAPDDLDLDVDLAYGYGLTSLNKVLFLMSACDDAGVSLAAFTEPDVARMTTLREVTTALTRNSGEVA